MSVNAALTRSSALFCHGRELFIGEECVGRKPERYGLYRLEISECRDRLLSVGNETWRYRGRKRKDGILAVAGAVLNWGVSEQQRLCWRRFLESLMHAHLPGRTRFSASSAKHSMYIYTL